MAKEFFHYSETANLFDLLEEATQRSGVSRGQAFEDFLTMSVCALSGRRMEELYLQTVAKHTAGNPGKRGCDSLAKLFAETVVAMEQDTCDEMKDILGDLFEGAITYGEHQQYMTPMPVCRMMASLTVEASVLEPPSSSAEGDEAQLEPEHGTAANSPVEGPKRVCDPCCGSGRMLLAMAEINRHWEFYGQDIDLRCVRMTALNLAFRNLYGYVIWGNTLAVEKKLVYRTGFDGIGFVREIPLTACPAPVRQIAATPSETPEPSAASTESDAFPLPKSQLKLF